MTRCCHGEGGWAEGIRNFNLRLDRIHLRRCIRSKISSKLIARRLQLADSNIEPIDFSR